MAVRFESDQRLKHSVFFFVLHANFAKLKSAYLLLIFLHTKQSWPSDLSMINGLDPSEDQQNHSKFPTHKRKSHKISLHSSDSQRCRTANPQSLTSPQIIIKNFHFPKPWPVTLPQPQETLNLHLFLF